MWVLFDADVVLVRLHSIRVCRGGVLKENEHADGHWNQYSKGCLDCDIQYDVIGRMETFEEDVKYIILKNGWEHILPIESITKVHMNKGNTAGIKENDDKKKECLRYFSKLKN